jgi:AraC family transcriptional regulator, regulatory protein of adaptative response / methylated-DNA-[protein]-cysteine methyltransferase
MTRSPAKARGQMSRRPPEELHYAMGQTAVGHMLVARSQRGVVAVLFDESPGRLVEQLFDRHSTTRILHRPDALETLVGQIAEEIERPTGCLAIALDVRGTPFQVKVWRALMAIPLGKTLTFGDVARRIGAPRAAGAVRGACTRNPLEILIPCHRVLHSDGAVRCVIRQGPLLVREGAR